MRISSKPSPSPSVAIRLFRSGITRRLSEWVWHRLAQSAGSTTLAWLHTHGVGGSQRYACQVMGTDRKNTHTHTHPRAHAHTHAHTHAHAGKERPRAQMSERKTEHEVRSKAVGQKGIADAPSLRRVRKIFEATCLSR